MGIAGTKVADLYGTIGMKGLGTFQTKMSMIRGTMVKVEASMVRVAAISKKVFMVSAAAIVGTTYAAAKFEKQLAMVSTMLSEADAQWMPKYKRGLEELSVAFGESTATLSKGLYDILSASIAPAQAMEVLAIATKAARGGITDTAVATDAITTILNAYGLSADKATDVSDKLFATVKRGKLTFGELASSIGKVAATGAIAGLRLEELLAAISTITRAGIKSDQAMTSVVGVLRSFMKPTTEGAKLAKKLGFELNTATLKAEGFAGIMKKLNGLSAEQLAVLFPNIRGLKGIAAAMQDAAGFTKDLKIQYNSAGMAQEAFEKMSGTTTVTINQAKQSLIAAARAIGEQLAPAVKKTMDFIGKLAKAFTALGKTITGFVSGTLLLAVTFSAIALVVAKLISGFLMLLPVLKAISLLLTKILIKIALISASPIGVAVTLSVAAIGVVAKKAIDKVEKLRDSLKRLNKESAVLAKFGKTGVSLRKKAETEKDLLEQAKIERDRIKNRLATTKHLLDTEKGITPAWEKALKLHSKFQDDLVKAEEKVKFQEERVAEEKASKLAEISVKAAVGARKKIQGIYDKIEYIKLDKFKKQVEDARKAWLKGREDILKWQESAEKEGVKRETIEDYVKKWQKANSTRYKDQVKLIKKAEAKEKELIDKRRKETERQKTIGGLTTKIGVLGSVGDAFARAFLSPLQQTQRENKKWLSEIDKAFGKDSEEYKAAVQVTVKRETEMSKPTAGIWMGLTDVWRGLQESAVKPELAIAKDTLAVMQAIDKKTGILVKKKDVARAT